jgi:hypothetical protein
MTIHFSKAGLRTLPAEGFGRIFGRTFVGRKERLDPAPLQQPRGVNPLRLPGGDNPCNAYVSI